MEPANMKDYYEILHLPHNAQPEKIRKQYRLLVVACHPDKFTDPSKKAQAEEKIKEINEAYEVLIDPPKKARYDRQRASQSIPSRQPYTEPQRVSPNEHINHLHYEFHALRGDRIEISIDRQANVILVDDPNYKRYLVDQPFQYIGGFAQISPLHLSVPYSGIWHLVVDRGGYPGIVQAVARISRYW